MRLICLADTHNQHRDLDLPEGDILIHAGDCTDGGSARESLDFLDWFSEQPHKHKILVPGNHDFFFEKEHHKDQIPENLHVLIGQSLEIKGIKFWGSPYTPGMANWAFQRERGAELRSHWEQIPQDTQILITHTPPYGIMDDTARGLKLGCEELAGKLESLKPDYHLFGHIHHAAGSKTFSNTKFFNLSVLDERFRIMNEPAVIEL
ncbi:metallophosphatase domain-containing protein [Gramella sp. GC03-9]|uniref:Metallophosphatase domain-containing protein n=1 Tax=Christiangramia oceanisediminis TaxID=2920386 RepID=A0A9X2I3J8_9FLAO|nr:metallophosphatase domain-containing protein [Gramella oceanisediminis]MCP9198692.1 metallophosphatase domain-containing protein [Gramella oceanisediminis]